MHKLTAILFAIALFSGSALMAQTVKKEVKAVNKAKTVKAVKAVKADNKAKAVNACPQAKNCDNVKACTAKPRPDSYIVLKKDPKAGIGETLYDVTEKDKNLFCPGRLAYLYSQAKYRQELEDDMFQWFELSDGRLALVYKETFKTVKGEEKKAAPAPSAVSPAAAPVAGQTQGQVDLIGTEEKEAAVIMAIVSNRIGIPLERLSFKSIKLLEDEKKGDK